jgi:hypothetical protein
VGAVAHHHAHLRDGGVTVVNARLLPQDDMQMFPQQFSCHCSTHKPTTRTQTTRDLALKKECLGCKINGSLGTRELTGVLGCGCGCGGESNFSPSIAWLLAHVRQLYKSWFLSAQATTLGTELLTRATASAIHDHSWTTIRPKPTP